ncbi:MAG TPA: hypothetical protein PLJ46_19405, partial [Burkholderiaceae bacterium]|nr:hypothetical protein [Burkholderiaceae bacterium]
TSVSGCSALMRRYCCIMGVWAARSFVTSNSAHYGVHRGNNLAGKTLQRLHVGFQHSFGDGSGFERKQHQLQALHRENRAQATRDVIRRQLRDGQRDHHPRCKASEQVTLYVDNKWILIAHPWAGVLVNVELHLPDPQVIAPEAVLFEPRVLFVDPGFVCLIERLLLLLQGLSLAARAKRVELICRQNDGVDSAILLDEYGLGLGLGADGTKTILGLCRSDAHGRPHLGRSGHFSQ